MALSHELESNGNLKDNLFIDISPDSRWGTVRYGGEVINAKVCYLATPICTDTAESAFPSSKFQSGWW